MTPRLAIMLSPERSGNAQRISDIINAAFKPMTYASGNEAAIWHPANAGRTLYVVY